MISADMPGLFERKAESSDDRTHLVVLGRELVILMALRDYFYFCFLFRPVLLEDFLEAIQRYRSQHSTITNMVATTTGSIMRINR